jgi:HSP20 family molecular chaperone IbpA
MTQLAKFLDHNSFEPWEVLFKNFFERDAFFEPAISTKTSYPVDIYETPAGLSIEVAVAGIAKEDIDISTKNNVLYVTHEKKEAKEGEHYIQRGIAKRSFNFGWKFDEEKYDLSLIEASMDKGILEIKVPKLEEKEIKTNKIEIK